MQLSDSAVQHLMSAMVMVISGTQHQRNMMINEEAIQKAHKYKYLETEVNENSNCTG